MKIRSLIKSIAGSKNARDRRLAIRESWSTSETERRRQAAISSQLRLASLMTMEQQESSRIKEVLEFADCY